MTSTVIILNPATVCKDCLRDENQANFDWYTARKNERLLVSWQSFSLHSGIIELFGYTVNVGVLNPNTLENTFL